MSRRTQENIVLGVIVLILLGAVYMSLGYGPRARMVPIPLALFGLALAVVQLIWQNLRSMEELQVDLLEALTRRHKGAESAKEPTARAAAGRDGEKPARLWPRECAALGIVLGFLALTLLFGPIPAIFVFTVGYFALSRHFSWPKAAVFGALFTAVVYLLFVTVLEIQLYHGVLQPLVDRLR